MTGRLPSQLGDLTGLERLDLWGNQLSGPIPPELGNLVNLYRLSLGGNGLTGTIPPELGNLSSLRELYLHDNQLAGPIPPELGDLASLQALYLWGNQLSGAIPSELGNLANLRSLLIDGNRLTGAIPPELGSLSQLRQLNLSNNGLSGTIPPELGNLESLESLGLRDNGLTGCVPAGLRGVTVNDFADLGLPFCKETAPSPDHCGTILPTDANIVLPGTETWGAGCYSQARPGSHARYYTFTLTRESEVTVTLESEDADAYLYLRWGEARSGTFYDENDDHDGAGLAGSTDSRIRAATLAAGTYTVEATTYEAGETGSFTLAVSSLIAACYRGPLPNDGAYLDQWYAGCKSETPAPGSGSGERLALYYPFTLTRESEVTITLESEDADAYLYLRRGEARSGTALRENDDHEGAGLARSTDSLIRETLAAGTYTIEATTHEAGETGSFTLEIRGLGSHPCFTYIPADGTVTGQWAPGCSSAQPRGYAKYYVFTLNQQSEVTITLQSGDANTYLRLLKGNLLSGSALLLHENDDHEGTGLARSTDSQIRETLAAGTYTVGATTHEAGETGSFTLTVSGLGGGGAPVATALAPLGSNLLWVAQYDNATGSVWVHDPSGTFSLSEFTIIAGVSLSGPINDLRSI